MYLPNSGFTVPFVRDLDGPMHPGRVIAIFGMVPHGANRFAVNLQCEGGPGPGSDIALHLSVRFPERVVVRNSFQGGWQAEERDGGFPLHHGHHFMMLILCEHSHWKIAFNGIHFVTFHHRLPFERVHHIGVEGDVLINNVTGVLGVPLGIQTLNPALPVIQVLDPLFPGRLIRVQGRVPPDGSRFMFNLVTGPSVDHDDILFHVSYRAHENVVVLNTKTAGQWREEVVVKPCPVVPGQPFELLVLVDPKAFQVAFNGVHFTEFHHRMPFERINHLVIEGSVHLDLISIEGQLNENLNLQLPPPPPPHEPPPFFANPYVEVVDVKYKCFPNPYPIIF